MNDVFEEVMAHIAAGATGVRYMNWDIGQLDGYYLKPGVSFPCALISFPQINFESQGNLTQHGDTFMQIKLATASLSNTSNLTPALVRAKGNEIWEIEKLIMKALHGVNGLTHNSMMRMSVQKEEREDGINVLNIMYTFMKQDYTAKPLVSIVSPVSIQTIPFIWNGTSLLRKVADYITFNSDLFLQNLVSEEGVRYGYKMTSCQYNGENIDCGSEYISDSPSIQFVPIQSPPINTIPNHDSNDYPYNYLQYDENWIDFLNALPIADKLGFTVSPYREYSPVSGKGDTYWPTDLLNSKMFTFRTMPTNTYGEGFIIDSPLEATFSFEVAFLYIDTNMEKTLGHRIRYTEQGMYIDGAYVSAANMKIYNA